MTVRHSAGLPALPNHRRHFQANGAVSDVSGSTGGSTIDEYLDKSAKMATTYAENMLLTSDSPFASSTSLAFSTGSDPLTSDLYQTTPESEPYNSTLSLLAQSLYNATETDFLDSEIERDELVQQYFQNRALDSVSLIWLGIIYTVLIFIGAIGNGLVCLAVARQPKMRTSRNIFIINLAISDLLLCFFTIPFSLVEISTKSWPYGVAMCKLVSALEATSIFVSTLSITAIALDRYQVILHTVNKPDQCRRGTFSHVAKLLLIWAIGMLLALPLFLFRTVEAHKIGIPEIDPIRYCIEKWPLTHGRFYYSVFSMLIQYFVPIIIVSVVYTRLCIKLRSRTLRRASTTQLPKLRTRMQRRTRRTNMLLISIALIFCISWLPLNALNVISDLYYPFQTDRSFRITFAICHMAGMSSSCSNPFLYGWLNTQFKSEFEQIFSALKRSFMRLCMQKESPTNSNAARNCHSNTLMPPNQELVHYPNKNTECTVTDSRNAMPAGRPNRNVVVNFENSNQKNGQVKHVTDNKKKKKNRFLRESTTNETRTTQVYMNTTFGTDESTSIDAMNDVHFQPNGRNGRNNAVNRFKRLSLTDSRKRKRKKSEMRSHLSIPSIATDQTSVIMDSNNNDNSSHNSNGKAKTNKTLVAKKEEQSHDLGDVVL